MKKVKQILAILLVVLLIGLYITTLVMALIDDSATLSMFKASVAATIIVPVLIWAYSFIYKLIKENDDSDKK